MKTAPIAQDSATVAAREPVVEIHPSHLRVVGVKLSDAELIVLRNIAERMKGIRLESQAVIHPNEYKQFAERFALPRKQEDAS